MPFFTDQAGGSQVVDIYATGVGQKIGCTPKIRPIGPGCSREQGCLGQTGQAQPMGRMMVRCIIFYVLEPMGEIIF
jgi:hypothetical protein